MYRCGSGGRSFVWLLVVSAALVWVALGVAPAPALAGARLPFASPGPISGLVSASHPSQTAWYSNSDPWFSWQPSPAMSAAVAGYSYVLDQSPATVPDLAIERESSGFPFRNDYATDTSPDAVAVGDFNADGDRDLVTASSRADTVSVVLGNGDGTFAANSDYGTAASPRQVAVGDFNRDGKQDLVTANSSADTASVLLGNGDGSFAAKVDYACGMWPDSVAVGDFNGDGKQDLVTANDGAGTVSVLLGNGDGTFAAKTDFTSGGNPGSVAVGDFDRDGKQDLVAAMSTYPAVGVLLGNGDGTFVAKTDFATGDSPRSVVVGDLNGDGKQDLVTVNNGGWVGREVSVLLGNGDGTFAAPIDVAVDTAHSLALGDFNTDGKQDLATVNWGADTASVLLGNGDGSFAAKTDWPTGDWPRAIAVGDFNADSRPDLVTANSDANTVSVLVNQSGPAAAFMGKADGVRYFHARAVDVLGFGGSTATRVVRIDTRGPVTQAPYAARVRRGGTATLKYGVADPRPGSPRATVAIKIANGAGKVVKTLRLKRRAVNRLLSVSFTCRLARGTYTFAVYATDAAGNRQTVVGGNTLRVR